MTDEPATIAVDLNVGDWKVTEALEYRKRIGVNAEYALASMQRAWNAAIEEMRETFGEAMEADGWTPPADYIPLAIMNVDPLHLLGFAWIARHREHPEDEFGVWEETVPVGDLNNAFYGAMMAMVEAQSAAPLANRQQRRANGHRSSSASTSASSSTGDTTTSTTSPSEKPTT